MTEILEIAYDLHVSSELAVFGLATERSATTCERELKGLSGADANIEEREKVLPIRPLPIE